MWNKYFLACSMILAIALNGCGSDDKSESIASVTIGTQEWSAKNLNVTHYQNGDPIPLVTDSATWDTLTSGAYCEYKNSSDNGTVYGKLYNWYAVHDSRGLAPDGWRVASDADWTVLTTYLGGENVAGAKLREEGTSHWLTPNSESTNETGFTALPGGQRGDGGGFGNIKENGFWWTSNEESSDWAWMRYTFYTTTDMYRDYYRKQSGFSVRCIKE